MLKLEFSGIRISGEALSLSRMAALVSRIGCFPVYEGGFSQASSDGGTAITGGAKFSALRVLEIRSPEPSSNEAKAASATGTRKAVGSNKRQADFGGASFTFSKACNCRRLCSSHRTRTFSSLPSATRSSPWLERLRWPIVECSSIRRMAARRLADFRPSTAFRLYKNAKANRHKAARSTHFGNQSRMPEAITMIATPTTSNGI